MKKFALCSAVTILIGWQTQAQTLVYLECDMKQPNTVGVEQESTVYKYAFDPEQSGNTLISEGAVNVFSFSDEWSFQSVCENADMSSYGYSLEASCVVADDKIEIFFARINDGETTFTSKFAIDRLRGDAVLTQTKYVGAFLLPLDTEERGACKAVPGPNRKF